MIRGWMGGLLALLLVLILTLSLFTALLASEAGSHFLLMAVQKIPGAPMIQSIKGRILGRLVLEGIHVDQKDLRLDLDHLEIEPEIKDLLSGRLTLKKIALEGLTAWSGDQEWNPEIPCPLNIDIKTLDLRAIHLQSGDSTKPFELDHVFGDLACGPRHISTQGITLKTPSSEAQIKGSLSLLGERPLSLDAVWALKDPDPETQGHLSLSGTLAQSTLDLHLERPTTAHLKAQMMEPFKAFRWEGTLEAPGIDPRIISPDLPAYETRIHAQGSGVGRTLTLAGGFEATVDPTASFKGVFDLSSPEKDHLVIRQFKITLPNGDADLNLEGDVHEGASPENPGLKLQLSWRQLYWPFRGPVQWQSAKGKVDLEGPLSHLTLKAMMETQAQTLTASGIIEKHPEGFEFQEIKALGPGLQLSLDGHVKDTLDLAWNLDAHRLEQWLPDSRGTLQSQGHLTGTQPHPRVDMTLKAEGLGLGPVLASSLEGQLKGTFGTEEPIDLALKGERLQAMGAQLSQLNLRFKGPLKLESGSLRPFPGHDLQLELQTGRLQHPQLSLESLEGKLQLQGGPAAPIGLDVRSRGIRYKDQVFRVSAEGRGNLPAHQLVLTIDQEHKSHQESLQAAAEFRGGFDQGRWRGEWLRLDGLFASFGRWQLDRPAPLSIHSDGFELTSFCLEQHRGEACLNARLGEDHRFQGGLTLAGFSLEDIPSLKQTLSGTLEGQINVQGQGDLVTGGQAELQLLDPQIKMQKDTRAPWNRLQDARLRGWVTPRQGELTTHLSLPGMASFDAVAETFGPIQLGNLSKTRLQGHAYLDIPAINALEPIVKGTGLAGGTIRLEGGVRGTLSQPDLSLKGSLSNGTMILPRLGLDLKGINLQVLEGGPQEVLLRGGAVSGGGQLTVQGLVSLTGGTDFPFNVKLTGRRFLAMNSPDATILVSPDLVLARQQHEVTLQGDLKVPEAMIHLKDSSQKVKPSKDVVLIRQKSSSEQPPPEDFPYQASVRLVLGDKVQVKGPQYDAELAGEVLITQATHQAAKGQGEVTIQSGKVGLYGVDLEVHKGRFIFKDCPVQNPQMDIEVTRKSDDLEVGARILGTVEKPNISLFSDQPMPESDILRYLVMGGSPLDRNPYDSASTMNAASSLGSAAGSLVAKKLADKLGLGGFLEVNVENSINNGSISKGFGEGASFGGTQNTALFLGKYLTPKIYVQYGMGIMQNVSVFRLRYDLARHWKVQTEAGQYNSGDLLFTWQSEPPTPEDTEPAPENPAN